LAHADFFEELLLEDFTRCGSSAGWPCRFILRSMIVDDLNLMRIGRLPTETDAPYVVDPDAHLI
jgi:hypothetical protein